MGTYVTMQGYVKKGSTAVRNMLSGNIKRDNKIKKRDRKGFQILLHNVKPYLTFATTSQN